MKRNVLTSSLAILALTSVTLFSSCLKNDDNFEPEPKAGLFVLHAAPGIGGMDILLNNEDLTNGNALGYSYHGTISVDPNDYNIAFVKPVGKDTIASAGDSLRDGHNYSAILYDTGSAAKVMLFEDQFDQGQSGGSSFLRFLQLSPNDEAVSIHIDQDEFTSNRHFADNVADGSKAKFNPISAGQYNITALNATGDTLGSIDGAKLATRGYYTLYLGGYKEATVDSLKVDLNLVRSY